MLSTSNSPSRSSASPFSSSNPKSRATVAISVTLTSPSLSPSNALKAASSPSSLVILPRSFLRRALCMAKSSSLTCLRCAAPAAAPLTPAMGPNRPGRTSHGRFSISLYLSKEAAPSPLTMISSG
eukprot:scaffold412_cov311-Pavlova_lutheri.AAC.28